MRQSRLVNWVGAIVLTGLLPSGCSVIVEDMLQSNIREHDGGAPGPTGPACTTTADCLQIDARKYDCTQRCVPVSPTQGVCVSDDDAPTPDGTTCAGSPDRICVAATCIQRSCGDGYIDRSATPPEYCDEGPRNGPSATCHENCTRPCGVDGAPFVCDDGNPCNGVEMCDTSIGECGAPPPDPSLDGMDCTVDGQAGACEAGRCVPR